MICLCPFKNKLTNYLNDYFKEKAIQVMCWDSKTDGEIHFLSKAAILSTDWRID
jgi:hypothetical protein